MWATLHMRIKLSKFIENKEKLLKEKNTPLNTKCKVYKLKNNWYDAFLLIADTVQ